MDVLLILLVWTAVAQANVFYDFGDAEYYKTQEDPTGQHLTARRSGRGNSNSTSNCEEVIPLPDDIRSDVQFDDFYKKYTHAYGIPIVSSNAPTDAALIRACYVVRFMLADRVDLRDKMYDSYGRVAVIGVSERTTQIPEHSYLDSNYWDDRARGLGGIPRIPVSTTAEENLLCESFWFDRWYEEDILVHEFAHGIHLIAVRELPQDTPTFQDRLTQAHNAAKSKGLWQYTYAIYNPVEYFAEGVQSFFNVQTNRDFIDGVHNDISTRAALKDYDPDLYNLIEEVFPCKNTIVDRCVKDQGLAAAQELHPCD